ncbi:hypothetical protein [Selenomonas sp. KH1T6]|uniref:hypothetical protein n=1 Tax=Selenomonas sp. KH1T6 TaxID=3158784 RepID=UPI0008A7B071|nr:hypothetical protein SAMN05216583_11821 [Selenomonas ruminantium]
MFMADFHKHLQGGSEVFVGVVDQAKVSFELYMGDGEPYEAAVLDSSSQNLQD